MPQPQNLFGSYTSDGSARFIDLTMGVKKFYLFNHSNFATPANDELVEAWWQEGMDPDSAVTKLWDGTATALIGGLSTSGGITFVDEGLENQLATPVVGTALTNADPAVATATGHGYAVGDIVRVTNTTDMLQIAGMDFEITAVGGPNSYTLGYLDASGFANPASAIISRKLRFDNPFTPRSRYITGISQASQAVITFSVTHGYGVGDSIRIRCPSQFGMSEINDLVGEVVSVNTTNNTATVDIDSSGFSAFAFPASGSTPFSFPQAQFAGENSLLNSNPYENRLRRGVLLGADVVGDSDDVVYWEARFGY